MAPSDFLGTAATMQHIEAFVLWTVEIVRANQQWAVPIVFLMAFAECVALLSWLVPATVFFTAFGGVAAASGLNLFSLSLAASLGAGLGFWLSYWAGDALGPRVGQMWPLRDHPDWLPRGHDFFERWGMLGIGFGHFFGPVRAVVALVAGIVKMPILPFQLANWAAAFAWGFGLIYLGEWIGDIVVRWIWPFLKLAVNWLQSWFMAMLAGLF
jgi:membrane protein DedA with SNARE-associated domain